jgi:hypothetical protein
MRRITPVLALSTILAGIVFAASQHPADAACADGLPGCSEPTHAIGPLADAGGRRGFEDRGREREHEFPTDLWDKIRSLPIPREKMEDLTARLMDIMHRYGEAQGHVEEAEKKIFDADEAIDKAKSDRISGEAQKHAAEEERSHEYSRFVSVLEDAMHEFRPPPPPREARWEPRWHPPHRVFWHHFRGGCEVDPCGPCGCPVERPPVFFPLIGPPRFDP